jgi:hypothetical protein
MAQPDSSPPQSVEPSPEEIQKIFGQAVLTGLVALTLFALTFIFYVWKQKQELSDSLAQMLPQSKRAQDFDHFYNNFIYDLTAYSQQHPEILQVLAQSGVEMEQQTRPIGKPARQELPPMPAPPSGH